MITKYVKVPAYVSSQEDDDVKVTRKFLNENKGFIETLNATLLQYSVDQQAFLGRGICSLPGQPLKCFPKGTVRAYNWMEWAHEEDGLSHITSISTVCFTVEDKSLEEGARADVWEKCLDLTRKLKIYMYLKVEAEEKISKEEMNRLINYIYEQISDGWGENFWVEYKNYSIHLVEDPRKYKVANKMYSSIWLPR